MLEFDPGNTTTIVGESGQIYETTIGADTEAGEADAIEPGESGFVTPYDAD